MNIEFLFSSLTHIVLNTHGINLYVELLLLSFFRTSSFYRSFSFGPPLPLSHSAVLFLTLFSLSLSFLPSLSQTTLSTSLALSSFLLVLVSLNCLHRLLNLVIHRQTIRVFVIISVTLIAVVLDAKTRNLMFP